MKFQTLFASIPALAFSLTLAAGAAYAAEAQTRNTTQTSTQGNAQATAQAPAKTAALPAPMSVKDVETLLDKPAAYVNKRVMVSGEVEEQVDGNSFILESGGIINDEVTVVMGKSLTPVQKALIKEDANLMVTGTIRRVGRVEIERELGWDFSPQVEIELGKVDTFLVADDVTVTKAE